MCLRDTAFHHMTCATRCLDHGLVTGGDYGNVRGVWGALSRGGARGVMEVTVISD
jgi:hypothetical protein